MKNFKGFAMGLVLGLGLALSSVVFAQNAPQTDQTKKAESCCAMASYCCKGDSCPMNEAKDHASKDRMKTHASKDGCCCCGAGDSCDLKMHDMNNQPKGN